MKRKKAWSKTIIEMGYRVRLYERDGMIYREVRVDNPEFRNTEPGEKKTLRTKSDRISLEHCDRRLAEVQARQLARSRAELELRGDTFGSAATLGQIFNLYLAHKAPLLSKDRRQSATSRVPLFITAWGASLPVADISQTHVDAFSAKRRTGTITPLALRESRSPAAKGRQVGRKPVHVQNGTIDSDFRWLSSVFNWAHSYKAAGRRLLSENPLRDVKWPRETNVRRPVASHERFVRTMAHVDAIDAAGRLRCLLALARHTGRRIEAITELLASDVLLTHARMRQTLATMGRDEALADAWPNGAIRWRSENDKQGFDEIAPLSVAARAEVDRYLSSSRRMGDAVLFPAPECDVRAIERRLVTRWLLKAERSAELPKLEGGVWHPYRRLWATERKGLPDADVAAAGGWRDTRALKLSYQKSDAATMLRVVEGAG